MTSRSSTGPDLQLPEARQGPGGARAREPIVASRKTPDGPSSPAAARRPAPKTQLPCDRFTGCTAAATAPAAASLAPGAVSGERPQPAPGEPRGGGRGQRQGRAQVRLRPDGGPGHPERRLRALQAASGSAPAADAAVRRGRCRWCERA